ncbi:hypothetical protein J7J39_01555 [bacterium]|nr:hypothetical protein [bacterium]
MKKLPQFLKRYFWDVDFQKLDKKNYSWFIIERILEYGDEKAVKWMEDNFRTEEIKNVLLKSKNLSLKSANFWQFIFNLDKNRILCLKKSFQKRQKLIWKH